MPIVYVPEPPYLRWLLRPGGADRGWAKRPPETEFGAIQSNVADAISLIDRLLPPADEKHALEMGALLYALRRVRNVEKRAGRQLFAHSRELHPNFAAPLPPTLGARNADWFADAWQDATEDLAARGQGA